MEARLCPDQLYWQESGCGKADSSPDHAWTETTNLASPLLPVEVLRSRPEGEG